MDRSTAHLDLAIELESEPIAGSLTVPGANPQRFSGWIELVAAIEAARAGDPHALDRRNGHWGPRGKD